MTEDVDRISIWFGGGGDGGAQPRRVGDLVISAQRGHRVGGFSYDESWLGTRAGQRFDPDIEPYRGMQYPKESRRVFGFAADASPDRWGRLLMQRREAWTAQRENRRPRRLDEYDYLLGVHDASRMGAMRFRVEEDGAFVAPDDPWSTPPWTQLRELQDAAQAVERGDAVAGDDEWLRQILAPGSSLGGARPKASVVDEAGELWIAKFPSGQDAHDVGAWEFVTHGLARDVGLTVPEARLERFSPAGSTYLSRRFDRTPGRVRVHFASAMTLLGRTDGDGEAASYLDLAEIIRRYGSSPTVDLEQLWMRLVFFIAVGNTDDHLRNHGFLLDDRGWRLSPAYDINPQPFAGGLSLSIDGFDNALDHALALRVCGQFGLSRVAAESRLRDILGVVAQWRERARNVGIGGVEISEMEAAFADVK